MSTPLPPDPYAALGLDRGAAPAQIKSTYRKLVLKCHPDKVTDESKKAQAADDFHRIQQAYEILSDEGRRSRYDAQVKLAALRKEAMERHRPSSPHVNVKTAAYDVPTSSPGRTGSTARGPEWVYDDRKPPKSTDLEGDYFGDARTSPRKHDDPYRRSARKAAPRDDTDRLRSHERDSRANERFVRKKEVRTRDKDTRRERERKFSYPEDDSEPDLRYEATRRREAESQRERERLAKLERDADRERERQRELREREREKERERERAKERERERERDEREREKGRERDRSRRRPDSYEKTSRRYTQKDEEARAYMSSNRDKRPSASSRSASYVDVDRSGRPAMIRRVSTKDKPASPQASSRRERKHSEPDIPELPAVLPDRRAPAARAAVRPPTLHTAQSTPANIKLPRERDPRDRTMPPRSQSAQFEDRDTHEPPRASLRRAETAPLDTSPRRRDAAAPLKSSTLRNADTPASYPTPPTSPDPYTSAKYRYFPADDDRDRRVTRSPSPMGRPVRPSINTSSSSSSRYPSQSQTSPPRGYSYSPATADTSPFTTTRPPLPRRSETSYYGEMRDPTPTKTTRYEYPSKDRDYDDGYGTAQFAATLKPVAMASGYTARKTATTGHSTRPSMPRGTAY